MISPPPYRPDEVIIEFVAMAGIMRVSAMDPVSLTEVVVQGPVNCDRAVLADLAKRKLSFVLSRQEGSGMQIGSRGSRRL